MRADRLRAPTTRAPTHPHNALNTPNRRSRTARHTSCGQFEYMNGRSTSGNRHRHASVTAHVKDSANGSVTSSALRSNAVVAR